VAIVDGSPRKRDQRQTAAFSRALLKGNSTLKNISPEINIYDI